MTNGTEEEQRSMDEKFMRLALNEARKALAAEEVPIGAVVVSRGRSWGGGTTSSRRFRTPRRTPKCRPLTAAAATVGGKYLPECTLYVTVEPCVMCAGAIAWAQTGAWCGAPTIRRGATAVIRNRSSIPGPP